MTFKSYSRKLDKAITQLSGSLDLEEELYIQGDAQELKDLLKVVLSQLQQPSLVVSLPDHPFKLQCQKQVDEAMFFLKEAEEFLS